MHGTSVELKPTVQSSGRQGYTKLASVVNSGGLEERDQDLDLEFSHDGWSTLPEAALQMLPTTDEDNSLQGASTRSGKPIPCNYSPARQA